MLVRFTEEFLQFYIDLAANNTKDWFDVNRKRYEQHVKIPFKLFVSDLLADFSAIDTSFKSVEATSCIFRINRDVRFAKDKTPYKLMSSAVISSMGKSKGFTDGIYLELSPEHVRVYGGIYQLDTDQIYMVREGIASRIQEFKSISTESKFIEKFGSILGEKNKVIPKEFRQAANEIPLLYNKQWYFYTTYPAEFILSPHFRQQVVNDYKLMLPIEHFFKSIINENK